MNNPEVMQQMLESPLVQVSSITMANIIILLWANEVRYCTSYRVLLTRV